LCARWGVEGRMFTPMAMTYGLALSAALVLALTYSPALSSLVLKPHASDHATPIVRWLNRAYTPMLRATVARPGLTIAIGAAACAATLALVPLLGGEFMPKLEEGNLWIRASMPNEISFPYATELADRMRMLIRKYPQL